MRLLQFRSFPLQIDAVFAAIIGTFTPFTSSSHIVLHYSAWFCGTVSTLVILAHV